jgi:hypothetical protein
VIGQRQSNEILVVYLARLALTGFFMRRRLRAWPVCRNILLSRRTADVEDFGRNAVVIAGCVLGISWAKSQPGYAAPLAAVGSAWSRARNRNDRRASTDKLGGNQAIP